jgi:hypothetical protein
METAQVFRPETISRKGEHNAWILVGIALIVELIMIWRYATPPLWITVLLIILLFSATLISLSNWVDRKTVLILESDGIEYRNGLRNASIKWDQIEKIRVTPDRWGSRVHVLGSRAHFNFRMLSDIEFQGKVRGQMGFPEGETILNEIIRSSGLSLTEDNDQDRYYARP